MKIFFTFLIFVINLIPAAIAVSPFLLPPDDACSINLGPDITVCNNAEFMLNPHPEPGATFSWTGSIGLSCYDCPSPTVSGLTTGIYVFIATISAPGCTANDTIRITVINGESPKYEITEDRGICAGDSVALGGTAMPGVFYNWSSQPPGFASTSANPKDKPSGQKTYFLSVSNASCPLPVLDSVKITPVSLNLQVSPLDTVRICQGKSSTFQATVSPAGQPVTWSPTIGLQVGPNGTTAVATPFESTLYTATVSFGGCVRQRFIYVAVDSLPQNINIQPSDTTICQGQTVTLSSGLYDPMAFPKIKFKWNPLLGALSPDSLAALIVQPQQNRAYRRITQHGVCADTSFAVVNVVPQAQMMVLPADTAICIGESVGMSLSFTSGVTNISWSPTNGLSCTSCNNPVAKPLVTTNYTISGTFQNCPVSTTANILVKPGAPLKFPNDVQLCPGESVQLNEVFDPAAKYIWTSTHPGFGTDTLPNPIFKPTQSATYYVQTDNGCVRTDSIQIFVSNANLSVDGDTTVCKNIAVPLTASANLPGPIQWRNLSTGQIVSTMNATIVTPSVTTDYAAIFTFGDNCQLSDTVTVTIAGEAPEIIFPTDTKLCPGENITLNSGAVLPNSVYTWVANPFDSSLVSMQAAPTVSPNQNTNYSVTATLGNCTITQQIAISVFTATLAVSSDTTICATSATQLTAAGSVPNGTYAWSSGEALAVINVNPSQTTVYTVTYTYGDNCQLMDSIRVTTAPNFELSIDCFPDTSKVDIGTEVTLIAIVDPPQSLSNFQFDWDEITIDVKRLPFTTESIDVVPSTNDTNVVTYLLTATSPAGCSKAMLKSITLILPNVIFPNAFTPDGDGNNDVFQMVEGLKGLSTVDRMEIFSRWGQKVFESTDPNAFWDGTINGNPAPSDTYIYRVWWRRGDNALQSQSKGDLILLR